MLTIELATKVDLPNMHSLLKAVGLCTAGLDECSGAILIAKDRRTMVGSAALELFGRSALLRSVAVAKGMQRRDIGGRLVTSALGLARQLCVSNVYLITETARDYFLRHGFCVIERSEVPESVRTSVEFTQVCPDTATVMWTSTAVGTGR
jgi:amino-acid N-acetyltransferase